MSQCILAIVLFLATGFFVLLVLSAIPVIGIFILAAALSDESLLVKMITVILLGILIVIVGFFDFHIFGYTRECWEVIWNYVIG